MSDPGVGWSGEARIEAAAEGARQETDSRLELETAVDSLCAWCGILREEPYSEANADERLKRAFASPDDNPTRWCARRRLPLAPELETEFAAHLADGGADQPLGVLASYVLGRAAMRSAMRSPAGTSGLSLPYRMLWHPASDVGFLAADDELATALEGSFEAKGEINAEARRLGAHPGSAARGFDRERTEQAIVAAGRPASLEACAGWRVRDVVIDLPFGRVVQLVGSRDPAWGSRLLDIVANPALNAVMLSSSSLLDVNGLARMLAEAATIFTDAGAWNGRTSVWTILVEIEERLVALLDRAARSGAPSAAVEQAVRDAMVEIEAATRARPDGPRLLLEWMAHLLWGNVFLSRPSTGARLGGLPPRHALLDAVAAHFRAGSWSHPLRVRALFGGGTAVAVDGRSPAGPASSLPVWMDWLGKGTSIAPLGVAIQLWDGAASSVEVLSNWVRDVCAGLENEPMVNVLAQSSASPAAQYLAWPLVHLPNPASAFALIWSDAAWLRTRVRFARLEDASVLTQPAAALVRVGLAMLSWPDTARIANPGPLAIALADAVDELRYGAFEIGLSQWSGLAGTLARGMATHGLLDSDGCSRLLRRYHGDDDSLAAAAVNARDGGVAAELIGRALADMGDRGPDLAGRWARWNDRLARDENGKPGRFLELLTEIARGAPQSSRFTNTVP